MQVSKNNVLQLFVCFSEYFAMGGLAKKILQSELEEEKHCLESSPGDMVAAGQISQEFTRGEKKSSLNFIIVWVQGSQLHGLVGRGDGR